MTAFGEITWRQMKRAGSYAPYDRPRLKGKTMQSLVPDQRLGNPFRGVAWGLLIEGLALAFAVGVMLGVSEWVLR